VGARERTKADDWLDALARELDVAALSARETGEILRAARDVAHGVERRLAPLASFLLGTAVAHQPSEGGREESLHAVVGKLRALLPEPE